MGRGGGRRAVPVVQNDWRDTNKQSASQSPSTLPQHTLSDNSLYGFKAASQARKQPRTSHECSVRPPAGVRPQRRHGMAEPSSCLHPARGRCERNGRPSRVGVVRPAHAHLRRRLGHDCPQHRRSGLVHSHGPVVRLQLDDADRAWAHSSGERSGDPCTRDPGRERPTHVDPAQPASPDSHCRGSQSGSQHVDQLEARAGDAIPTQPVSEAGLCSARLATRLHQDGGSCSARLASRGIAILITLAAVGWANRTQSK